MQTSLLRIFSGWIVLSYLAALALPLPAAAAGKPDWVERVRPDDGTYKYYVGRSSEPDDRKAFNEAYEDAAEAAMKENYGALLEVSIQTYDDGSKVIPTRRVTTKIPKALINDFEIVSQHRDGKTLYVLYRYKIATIEQEKARIAAGKPLEEEKAFTTSKGSSSQKGGLEVITTPDDISISIDSEPWGKTPLKIERKLSPGVHTLLLDHPDYLTVYEQVIINPNQVTKVTKTLSRAKGTIRIDTTPVRGTQIFVDGNLIGSSPIDHQILSGIPVGIKATHPEAEEASTKASVTKDDIKPVTLTLSLKPSSISVYSEPTGATVYLNNAQIGVTPLVKKSAEAHKTLYVTLAKDGYQNASRSVSLKGGEDEVINIELQKIPQVAIEKKDPSLSPKKNADGKDQGIVNPWVLGIGFDISGSAFKDIDATLLGGYLAGEKRYGPVGLELRYSFFLGHSRSDESSVEDKDEISGNQLTVGLPVHPFGGWFYIKLEFGFFTGEASHYTDGTPRVKQEYDIKTIMYGLAIGLTPNNGSGLNIGFGMRKYNSTDEIEGDLDYTCFIGGGLAF